MEKTLNVDFRNVGKSYFPQSRVDCHYSLTPKHSWASNDWIGLFRMGWSSVKEYHTFVWALTPSGYQEGTAANCCVHFQASYLPGPSEEAFQFVYVDGKGVVCARSSPFTFCAPKPLEELVTLEEGGQGEGEGQDMLLVIPRAELLQGRLEECLRERSELLQAREAAERGWERERERGERAKEEWDRARGELEDRIVGLKEELRWNVEKVEEMEKEQQEVRSSKDVTIAEKDGLLAERAESQQRIKELQEDIKALTQRASERETELERMKEKVKKMMTQRKEEEEERKSLQSKLELSEEELRCLSTEFQALRSSLAQRDTRALQLKDSIATLTNRLHAAQNKEAENQSVRGELLSLRERLAAGERVVDGLKGELSTMSARRDQCQADVHQARLQAAQLTLQLADTSLALREGRASWAQEREGLQHSAQMDRGRMDKLIAEVQQKKERLQEERMEREKAEVELGQVKDCHRVQLGEARRELQELKSSLRVAEKEKERLLMEKQEMMEYVRQLEQRLEAVADAKWSEAVLTSNSHPSSPLSDSEDENPEALQVRRATRPLYPDSLCDLPSPETLHLGTPPLSSREMSRGTVVISQPAPLSSTRKPVTDTLTHSSDSEEEPEITQSGGQSSGDETALLLPNHRNATVSELADTALW